VGGSQIGAHRAFWRGVTRDQFVAKKVFGFPALLVGNAAESTIIEALHGETPFGNDIGTASATMPRMPADMAAMPAKDIDLIVERINLRCPEQEDLMRMAAFHSLALVVLATTAILPRQLAAQERYEPVAPGYDFPADEATLLRFRDTQNVQEMRRHAWYVFAGLTQPAKGGEARWETWFPADVTFSSGAQPQALTGTLPSRLLQRPRQFSLPPGQSEPQAAGESVLARVMFNREAHEHIRNNRLHLRSALTALNNSFTSGTPVEKRAVPPFPGAAMTLKLVWKIVRSSGLTPIPVWDFQPTRPDPQGNPEATWARVVAVDPNRTEIPENETTDLSLNGVPFPKSRVVALSRFYHFRIGPAEIGPIQAIVPTVAVGDYAVFVGMHYTTKEIEEWIWSTFWWHDEPDKGPFGSDRPSVVSGVWRNYLMDTAYSMDVPKEYDGTPNSVFNPYLEARFPSGMGSNCMTCHQKAVWGANGPVSFLPVTRGARRPDDPIFQNTTKLDFLWSIGLESQ
jgi:hypothetical protein